MRYVRYNEPRDPELRRISKVFPDRWLDERWPQKQVGRRGRWQGLRTSQLVRAHALALVKRLDSFNRVCRELVHNMDFRRFCRLRADDPAPTSYLLSAFRKRFGLRGWEELHLTVLGAVAELFEPRALGITLVDASDLPAAIRRTAKKKTAPRWRNAESKPGLERELDRKRAASRFSSRATRNTRSMPC